MAGIGQTWTGNGAVSGSAVAVASGAGTTLASITSTNGLSIATAWVWARSPGDASMQNFTLNFGASALGFIPVVGGPENAPIPASFLFTGDGATAVTVKNVGATLDRVVIFLMSVLAANA